VRFELWSAKRVWSAVPFQGGKAAYLRFADKSILLHDGSFGYGKGSILVSPDRKQIIVQRAFEGGETSGFLIDLDTLEHREWLLFKKQPDVTGWDRQHWRTELEETPRRTLHKMLSSATPDEVEDALVELECREYQMSDWDAMAKVFADPLAPVEARRRVGLDLVNRREEQFDDWRRNEHFGSTTMPAKGRGAPAFDYDNRKVWWPEQMIRQVASALTDDDPEIRRRAAWALSRMAPDAPSKVDMHAQDSDVRVYQKWWEDRPAR
jgi:hypothetical protein